MEKSTYKLKEALLFGVFIDISRVYRCNWSSACWCTGV